MTFQALTKKTDSISGDSVSIISFDTNENAFNFILEFESGGNIEQAEYRTDVTGEGLYILTDNGWNQVAGKGQFLPPRGDKAAQEYILRYFTRHWH